MAGTSNRILVAYVPLPMVAERAFQGIRSLHSKTPQILFGT